ncbi:MAG TPA: SET domain-containing protein-lysine N-methyltransferase [Pyrinomonadaceae bacterium]|nr:SET domain-containing protein-lysine N-methyltransferase [Pyrinomonadaceae bacterium]
MLVVRNSLIDGLGVFAQRDYAAAEVIAWIDDSRIVDDEHPLLPGESAQHCDYLEAGRVVLMQEPERHINSSCDPSAYVRTVDGKRCVVARRAIHSGDEITCDYIIDCHGGRIWQCRCGSSRCRRTIVASFFDLPLEWQREYLPLLNPWFVKEHDVRIQQLKRDLLEP